MIRRQLNQFLVSRRCTLLGVGPMSVNCVDAAIELANGYNIPLMLIASRRQIDCAEMGGGYVNNWSTEDYAKYVIANDRRGKVILCRDHGGPWQNLNEVNGNYSLRLAMEAAKRSYEIDILSGFQVIHIDPSVDIHARPSKAEILERVFELYEHCWTFARQHSRNIIFEVGTEEQTGATGTTDDVEDSLKEITRFCAENNFPQPVFVVMQTGTKVCETRNVGTFDSPFRIVGELAAEIQVPRMLELCTRYNIFMKEHNTDYLSEDSLKWHPPLGIHAANVAPEFGVAETRALIKVLRDNNQDKLAERFLALSLGSNKWNKWMVPNSTATDFDRAVIAGHYIFGTEEFAEIKKEAFRNLYACGIDLDDYLKKAIKAAIKRYIYCFNMVGSL